MLLVAACCVLFARAAQAEHTATLPVSNVTLSLPGSSNDWSVSSHNQFDVLQRLSPSSPALEMRLIVQPSETRECVVVLFGIQMNMGGRGELNTSPSYVPSSWAQHAVELEEDGKKIATVCAKRSAGGLVLGIIGVRNGELAQASSATRMVLSGYLNGVNGGPAPAPTPAPPPASPSKKKLTLVVTGVTIEAPPHWDAKMIDPEGQPAADRLDRRAAGQPAMTVFVATEEQDCATWERIGRNDAASGFRFVTSPAYLPPGWQSGVAVKDADGSKLVGMCVDVERGKLKAMVAYRGSLSDPAMMDARDVLWRVAHEAGAKVPKPAGAVVAGASSDGTGDPASGPASSADVGTSVIAGPEEPPSEPFEPDEPFEDDEPWERLGIGVEATVLHIGPDNDVVDGTVGGAGGIFTTFDLYDSEYFGLDLHLSGALGYNGQDNWMGNVDVGAQPIVRLGPIGLSMVGGLGWDTVSGSDEPTADEVDSPEQTPVFKAPSAIYGFFGGRLNFRIVSAIGLVGGVDQCFRNDDMIDSETRINGGVSLWFGGPVSFRLLFRYLHYAVSDDFAAAGVPSADALGGSLGVVF
jgi:hypothetical protein